jgi:hypothetical protein
MVLSSIYQGKSLTILFILNDEYDVSRIELLEVYIGTRVFPHTLVGSVVRCELSSNDTARLSGSVNVSLSLDDSVLGVLKSEINTIEVKYTNAGSHNESVNTGVDISIPITISENNLVVGGATYNYVKGEKGDSAYQVAVDNGFVGTESEWLLSLDGDDGYTPYIQSDYWYINGVNTGVKALGVDGSDGNGIDSITLLSTVGLEKTYRILFTDATTFDYTVTDGVDGVDGTTTYTTTYREDISAQTDGIVSSFTLAHTPMDLASCQVFLNGSERTISQLVGNVITLPFAPVETLDFVAVYRVNTTDIPNLENKVDKETGKSLIEVLKITKLDGIETGAQVNVIEGVKRNGVLLTPASKVVDITVPTQPSDIGAQPALGFTPENSANKGANNGYASLDSGGKVPVSQLPSTLLKYIGQWDALTNTPTLTNPDTAKAGYVYDVSVGGTQFGLDFVAGDWLIYNSSGVPELSKDSNTVVTVNGQTGAVTITLAGLGGEPANANIQSHISSTSNPHGTTYSQVGAAPANHNHDGQTITPDVVEYQTPAVIPTAVGSQYYDETYKVLSTVLGDGVILQNGLEMYVRGVNKTGSPLVDGEVVYISTAQGNRPVFARAIATSEAASYVIGVITHTIANNGEGFCTVFGTVNNINTSTYIDGAKLYISATVAGQLTNTRPVAPNHCVIVGLSLNSTVNGSIFVNPMVGYELTELHDVDTTKSKTTPVDADSLFLQDSADSSIWKKFTIANLKTFLAGIFAPKIASTTVTTNTVIDGTFNHIISNGTSLSHTLPTAATYPNKEWSIYNENATDLTLVGTISGDSSITLQEGESLTFFSNGTNLIAK